MRLAAVLFPITLLIMAGCASVSGVVTGTTGSRAGAKTPDIQYTTAEGHSASFNWARCPVALVAFTATEGPAGAGVDPHVADLADRLGDLPVTVAQLSLPPEGRSLGLSPEALPRKSGMMFLYDADRLAWNAYGHPAPGDMFLIGNDGDIVMAGSLNDPEPILLEARRLGEVEQQQREIEKGLGG